jgi:DNA-binding transcriptional LysR family regulator
VSLLDPRLEAFVAVVRHSTVRGAASEIGLTQTGVTQRIRSLERRVGATLFTRSRRGMRLTPEGEALYRYCQRVTDMGGELLAFMSGQGEQATHRLEITGPSSIMRVRIIPAALSILDRFPGVAFTFNLDDDRSGLAYLKDGRAQLAVIPADEVVDELDSRRLRPARYILVGPRAWKGRPVREIVTGERIVDFNESDDATFRYLRRYRLYGKARKERHFANNTDALASMVAAGRGYSVLSEDFARPLIENGRLVELNPGKSIPFEFALAWYPRHEMPGYFRAVVRGIR